jgi:cytochrome c
LAQRLLFDTAMEATMHFFFVVAALALSSALADAAAAADESGEQVFNNACRTCHSWKKDDNRLGPTLHGIVGKPAGAVPGYTYSQAMKTSGLTWDEATLDKFIAQPDSVIPNNNMKPFTGISDAGQRKQIVEFLKSNPK